jgi:hypothetical protein
MDKSKLYCVLWNPVRRYVQTETLENHLASTHRQLQAGFNSQAAEILLEITEDEFEQAKLAEKWNDLLNPIEE